MGQVTRFTDSNFKYQVLESSAPVLVDFWASWCPPCKMVEPVIAELAVEYEGRIEVGKLQVDRNPKTRDFFKILGVPTFAVFRNGEIVVQRTGAQSKDQLRQMLDAVLS
jgi:thioredoxin 1